MRYYKYLILLLLTTLSLLSLANAQEDLQCPQLPSGLGSASNLQWLELNKTIQLSVGYNNQNKYLQTWLQWDIDTGELSSSNISGIVEALQFAENLDIYDAFLDDYDSTSLSVSPSGETAIYRENSRLFAATHQDPNEPIELGLLPENLSKLDVYWISDELNIIVVEPIYGEFAYQIFKVCLDGSCFDNISETSGTFIGNPLVNLNSMEIMFHADSNLIIYDLETLSVKNRIPIGVQILPFLNPITSITNETVYFIGLDEIGIDLVLYELNILSQEQNVLVNINPDIVAPSSWIFSPEEAYMVFTDPNVHVQCL